MSDCLPLVHPWWRWEFLYAHQIRLLVVHSGNMADDVLLWDLQGAALTEVDGVTLITTAFEKCTQTNHRLSALPLDILPQLIRWLLVHLKGHFGRSGRLLLTGTRQVLGCSCEGEPLLFYFLPYVLHRTGVHL